MNYTLKRSKRKTLAIHITKDATVEVRAPHSLKKEQIESFVSSKEKWIIKHLKMRVERNKNISDFKLDYGSFILLRGKEYQIKSGDNIGFSNMNFYLPPNLCNNEIKETVICHYKQIAKEIILERVEFFAKIMNVTPISIKINGAKTRWRSCSAKGNLNFSWRLVMASDNAIDYVVVHELSHIKEHNHSNEFWTIVESVLPDYKDRQQQLTKLQKRISNESWS